MLVFQHMFVQVLQPLRCFFHLSSTRSICRSQVSSLIRLLDSELHVFDVYSNPRTCWWRMDQAVSFPIVNLSGEPPSWWPTKHTKTGVLRRRLLNQTILTWLRRMVSRMSCLNLMLVRLALNGTNLGLFKISFSTFWRPAKSYPSESKCTETDLKKICFFWG